MQAIKMATCSTSFDSHGAVCAVFVLQRYACQIFEHAKQQLPGLEKQIAAGDFKPLKVSFHVVCTLVIMTASMMQCCGQQNIELLPV